MQNTSRPELKPRPPIRADKFVPVKVVCLLLHESENRTPAWKVVNQVRTLQSKIRVSCARCATRQRIDLFTDRVVRELYRGAKRKYTEKLLDAVLYHYHAYKVICPCCGLVGHLPHDL
jgi:hypothetical protein